MTIKNWLKMSTVTAATLYAMGAAAAPINLKVAHFLPSSAPGHEKVIAPWCEKIAAESNGELQCEIYPAMQLGGSPTQLFNQVRDGVADVVWTLPGYTPGRFPITEVFELPFLTTTHVPSSKALWEFVQNNALDEYTGTKLIATWVNGTNPLHMSDKAVRNLDDLKGLKIRAPSRLGNRLLSVLGATAVGMPVPQMAESLSKGVIDGALMTWEVLPSTKSHELTKYHTDTAPGQVMTTATMVYLMNEKRYNSLPDHLKEVIDNNSGMDVSAWAALQFEEADRVGKAAATDRGNEVIILSPEETAVWQRLAEPVVTHWVEEAQRKNLDGGRMVNEARDLVKKHSAAQ